MKELLYIYQSCDWGLWKYFFPLICALLGLWFAWLVWFRHAAHWKTALAGKGRLDVEIATLREQIFTLKESRKTGVVEPDDVRAKPPGETKQIDASKGSQMDTPEEKVGLYASDDQQYELLDTVFQGEPAALDPDIGVIYTSPPQEIDDLTELQGVDLASRKKLNDLGIYNFKQISHMTDSQFKGLESRLGWRNFDWKRWKWWVSGGATAASTAAVAAAEVKRKAADQTMKREVGEEHVGQLSYDEISRRYFKEEPVNIDQELGVVFRRRPDSADLLTKIEGITEEAERDLNRIGVYRFAQISNWNALNVWAFNKRLGFKGKIERDEWISQASKLA